MERKTLTLPLYVVGIRPARRLARAKTFGTWEERRAGHY